MTTPIRRRGRRLELRTTPEERELLDRAVAVTGTDLTDFVVRQASLAAQRVLTDRTEFTLSAEPLAERHEVAEFALPLGGAETEWLRRYARQPVATGTTRVFVVTETNRDAVVAYYAWCIAQVAPEQAPVRMRAGAGRYPQSVALLAGPASTASTKDRVSAPA